MEVDHGFIKIIYLEISFGTKQYFLSINMAGMILKVKLLDEVRIFIDEWMDGTPLRYSTNTIADMNYYVTLQTFKQKKLELSSNCQEDARPVECGSTRYARK